MLASIFAKSMAERLSEHDLWWQLKTGQLIAATHRLPAGDPFSFTVAGKHWVVQEWGSEVILRAINAAFGLRGIIVWRSVMLLCIYAVLSWLLIRIAGNSLGTWVAIGIAAFAGIAEWLERPLLFSMLIFAIVLSLVYRRSRRVWLCVPLFVLWANLHAEVILGLGFMVLIMLVEWLQARNGTGQAWVRKIALVTVGCIAATIINPYGPKLFVYAFSLTRTVSSSATEWASPDFHQPLYLPFLILIALTVGVLAISRTERDLRDAVLTVTFLALGLYSIRNLPFAGMVLGTVVARHAPDAFPTAFNRGSESRGSVSFGQAPAVAGILVVSVVLGLIVWNKFPSSGSLSDVADQSFPVATIASLPSSGVRLFSDDRWAGLVIYMKWPGVHIAFDGRGDVYGKSIIADFQRTITGSPGWETWLNETCATHVLIMASGGLAGPILASSDWRVIRRDPLRGDEAILLARARPAAGC